MSHHIESELLRPAPRRVRWRWKSLLEWLGSELIILPFTLAGLYALAMVSHQAALAAYGRTVPAHILKLEHINNGYGSLRCCVRYSYIFRGVTYVRQSDVTTLVYSSLEAGAQPSVKILRWAPQLNSWPFVAPQRENDSLLIPLVIALIFNAFLGSVRFSWYREILLSKRLVASGTAVTGEIINRAYPLIGSPRYLKYTYSSESLPVRIYEGRALLSPKQKRGLKELDAVTVLYDPEKPARSIVYLAAYHDAFLQHEDY